jgi:hypothetical protein
MKADLGKLAGVIASVPEGLLLCLEPEGALEDERFNPLRRIW